MLPVTQFDNQKVTAAAAAAALTCAQLSRVHQFVSCKPNREGEGPHQEVGQG